MSRLNKSQVADLIARGVGYETFQHETLGVFDISSLRQMIARNKPKPLYCLYSELKMVDGVETDALQYLIEHRDVDMQRCAELTERQLDDPLIYVDCPPYPGEPTPSQLLIDGVHRLVERKRRGKTGFYYFLIPLDQAPRIPERLLGLALPWGEKDIVPGVGLVPHKEK